MKAFLLTLGLFFVTLPLFSSAAPSHAVSTFEIESKAMSHFMQYGTPHPIGACVWLRPGIPPTIKVTPEMDEYLPDLLVTVYSHQGDDPWLPAKSIFDHASYFMGNGIVKFLTGFKLRNSDMPQAHNGLRANSVIQKYVDVFGNPFPLNKLPFIILRSDTTPFAPYYSSSVDLLGRFGIADSPFVRPEDLNFFSYYIGSSAANKWGYEFPRDMSSSTTNDYKAAVMVALHAADIVTNKNFLHTVKSTQDSCGINCSVANVKEETVDLNEKWEEVYPLDRHIQLGENDLLSALPLGHADSSAGNGNYVFVIWRHYMGCIQSAGKLLYASVPVPPTIKR